jgi:hypothetical protein
MHRQFGEALIDQFIQRQLIDAFADMGTRHCELLFSTGYELGFRAKINT